MGGIEIYSEFEKLSPYNKKQLYDMIYPVVNNSSDEISDYLKDIRETRFAKGAYCPYCKSKHIIGHGKYRSRQRYKCKDCNKTFNDISCSPMAGTHYPDKWSKYIQCIADGMTLPKIVEMIDISISTAYYWRHKVLIPCVQWKLTLYLVLSNPMKLFSLSPLRVKTSVRNVSQIAMEGCLNLEILP